MSGQTTTNGSTDVVDDSGQTFAVEVPSGTSTPVSYLRMGVADTAAETSLPQDPAATGSAVKAISATTTTSPFSAGELVYTAGTTQIVAPYGYIRVGTPTTYESWLPTSTTPPDAGKVPVFAPSAASPSDFFSANGTLIYSNDTLQLFAPTISQTTSEFSHWSSDTLSVVGDSDGVISATRIWGSSSWPWSATFQRADAMNSTLGTTTNLITGNAITQWLGNDASTGTGGLLWSNYGLTQNLFGGQIVNIINTAIDVQGFGEVKVVQDYELEAAASIELVVSPPAGVVGTSAGAVVEKIAMIVGVVSALAEDVANGLAGINTEVQSAKHPTSDAQMRATMEAAFIEIAAASGAVLVTQAVAATAGVLAKSAAEAAAAAAVAGIKITPAGILLQTGPTKVWIDMGGIYNSTAGIINNIALANQNLS